MVIRPLLSIAFALAMIPAVNASPVFGQWQLDTELSDDVQGLLQDKKRQKKKQRQERQADQPAPGSQIDQGPAPLPLLAATTLQIVARGEQLEILPDKGRPLQVVPDGEAAPVSLSDWGDNDMAPVRFGNWEGDKLIMESTLEGGPHVIQTYSVDALDLLLQNTEVQRPPADSLILKRYFRRIDEIPESAPE